MANTTNSADPVEDAARHDDVERPAFISEEVWRVVQLAAEQNHVPVREYVEKALLDEAVILDQIRFGRIWMVKDKRGNVGEVEFT